MDACATENLTALTQSVQHNCAISDARHARDYSLCIYLLRMREYYRWAHQLPLSKSLDVKQVGDWLTEREQYWDDIEENEYQPIVIDGEHFDPFATDEINRKLVPQDLVYSAGIGRMGQPHFALATLLDQQSDDLSVTYFSGTELARDSITVPAMTRGSALFIRQDGIQRVLWEMYDTWRLKKPPGPMADVVSHYRLSSSQSLESNLAAASSDITSIILAHEQGEFAAAQELGPEYSSQTLALAGTHGEFYLRAVRDLYADSLSLWPIIVKHSAVHWLDFWLAGLNGIRLKLMEETGLFEKLSAGSAATRLQLLENLTKTEQQRWYACCQLMLTTYTTNKSTHANKVDAMSVLQPLLQSDAIVAEHP
ncbi:MAG: hypothetical protein KTR32_15975 [Granulosicoccus sp.]|nr:hypothetical protein [Granulosicoccus sp.]